MYQRVKKSLVLLLLLLVRNNVWGFFAVSTSPHSRRRTFAMSASGGESGLITSGGFEELPDDQAPDAFGRKVDLLPSVSNRINFGEEELNIQKDIWVVGTGTLGESIVKMLKEQSPAASIVAETKTNNRKAGLESLGVTHQLRDDRKDEDAGTAKTVIICLPPSSATGYANYETEIFKATRLWAGPGGGGNLIYTSSLAVYGPSNGNTVTEEFRVDTRSSRSTTLLGAEENILSRGGNVIRLAGLYTESRGPHTFWMQKAKAGQAIESNADGLVNLLHYEDAAAVTVAAAVSEGHQGQIFVASDNEVLTREEICLSAVASKLFPDSPVPEFTTQNGPIGKICDSTLTRKKLNWQPKYSSFRVYMRHLGGEDLPDAESQADKAEEESSLLWLPGDDDDDDLIL